MWRKLWFYYFTRLLIFYYKMSIAGAFVGKTYPAEEGEFPFIVSISYSDNIIDKKNHFCGGALISKRHVLTSAHCIQDATISSVMVVVKTLDFSSGRVYRVESWMSYDTWAFSRNVLPQNLDNDIAIITLSQDVTDVQPGKITELHDSEVIGSKVVSAGWGAIDDVNHIYPNSLLKVKLKVLNASEVQRSYLELSRELCEEPEDPEPHLYYTSSNPPAVMGCGDSGSPLLLACTKEIVGVNEAGCNIKDPQCNPFAMSRHIKLLNQYKDFIKDIKN